MAASAEGNYFARKFSTERGYFPVKTFFIYCSIFVLCKGYEFLGPALPKRAFISVWNAPTAECQAKWNVTYNLSSFDIVVNKDEKFIGDSIVLFYSPLGLWPYFDDNGDAVNGGIPQLGNLTAHLEKVHKDIITSIPDPGFQGIAVLDWEKWRPVFNRNWGTLSVYREKSIALVKQQHPTWPDKKLESEGRREFETAARNYMEKTLLLARQTRPKALWGYYGFPRCYTKGPSYNYKCSNESIEQNNQISWLFKSSAIIFPSIYLTASTNVNASEFAKYNVLEGFRLAVGAEGQTLPVFPYVRIVYALTQIFLNKRDIYSTIVQSAELGSAGVIIWGAQADEKTKEFCIQLRNYLEGFVGPLIRSITDIAQDCSAKYCSLHGRCRFKMDPLIRFDARFTQEMKYSWHFVKCMCFDGWSGTSCDSHVEL